MQYYPFDSRNSLYRSKIGALAEGETLRLRLLLHKDAHVHDVFLMIKNDNQEAFGEISMQGAEWLEDYRFYECEISLGEGLYWYGFKYTSDYGPFFVSKSGVSLGVVSNEFSSWQQTVFKKDFTTPDWLDGGIIYQIFPDRFFSSKQTKKNIPNDRFICEDWSKQPEFKQTEDLCSLGNDYYGGDLKGIEQKLDYIASLGVNCIYLNPIFEAHSNHRYNTANYLKIDPSLGTEKDLCSLVKSAKKRGISIILDGVFSHTGDDSIYFNKKNRYSSLGAYQSESSPYHDWFNFTDFPDKYEAWWGVPTLPETNENNPSFTEFITGENGVIRYWLKKGIKGWRLDVADELPDEFLDKIRLAVKSEGDDKFLLGEVWEDASNKISYNQRRRFLRGDQLDSVMNYPFANAIVDFLKCGNAEQLCNVVLSITENYPPQVVRLLMNHIGTHDTARILTRLGSNELYENDREAQSKAKLSVEEKEMGIRLLKLAAVLQYTLPGVPSLYYGDEAGLEGYGDPFCRATYPWGNENRELLEFYKTLGNFRRNCKSFVSGEFIPVTTDNNLFAFIRKNAEISTLVIINRENREITFTLPNDFKCGEVIFGNNINNGQIVMGALSFSVINI